MHDHERLPPRPLRTALTIMRIHMLASVFLLGLAVYVERPEVVSTNNYYYHLLNIPRETFPAICFAAVGAGIVSMVIYRRDTFALALSMAFVGLPFLIYALTATYFVYFVMENRTLVTGAMYWGAAGMFYVSLMLQSAIGMWVEQLAMERRRRPDGQ